jgi:hypothetical protein
VGRKFGGRSPDANYENRYKDIRAGLKGTHPLISHWIFKSPCLEKVCLVKSKYEVKVIISMNCTSKERVLEHFLTLIPAMIIAASA